MKTTARFLLVSAAAALLGVSVCAQTPPRTAVQQAANAGVSASAPEVKCGGTVTDAAGHPLAGATVEYWDYEVNALQGSHLELKRQITTGTNGAYEFQVSKATGLLLARKPGLAPAWMRLNQSLNSIPKMEERLMLTPPGVLAGVVVDETDKPVANAGVSAATATFEVLQEDGARSFIPLDGKPAHDCFTTRTDAAGHFRIENFPSNATATLTVQFPGKVPGRSQLNRGGLTSVTWRAGDEDIKLVMEPAGSIEGKITVEEGSQPPPVARLTLRPVGIPGIVEREPMLSGTDGVFHISDVPAGSFRIQAVFGTNAVPEWVAETVPVSVESGQTTRGAEVRAMRGGLLEVAVLGQSDRKPLAQARVNAGKADYQAGASSDSNGEALLRLPPGDYQVTASVDSTRRNQASASVEAGKTNRVEIEIDAPKKITGVVRQPDGQPAAGMLVRLVGGFGPMPGDVKTDAGGKFELEWNPRQLRQLNNNTACILFRDAEHNLAAAQDIEEDTGPLDLMLAPALTLAGRVESDGKPVTNAAASLIFWSGNRGMYLTGLSRGTNTPGRFEIPALPPGRKYGLAVSAPGFGQKMLNDVNASAEAGRMELDPLELKPASLKLAGQVLDADDKPVAGIYVMLNGEGQSNENARTDREGRFRFEHVCEGTTRLQANDQNSFGNISAEGGDTNVVLRLGQNLGNAPGATAHKLKGTVTDADGKPAAGALVAVFSPNQFNGRAWVKTATNGAFSLTWSLQLQMQSGSALLVARAAARNLAASEELDEDTTNLDMKLKPALTVAGLVSNPDDTPLAGAQVSLYLKAGNNYSSLDEQTHTTDAQGRYEIKCLPADASYMVSASAKGHGQSQRNVSGDSETNRLELSPFVLKRADCVLAGQVLDDNDKPVSGAMIQVIGQDQPGDNMTTDSKGRFHFRVCGGRVQLFANSPQGGEFAQASAEAGDTNVVINLRSQTINRMQSAPRAPLTGRPLPDLAGVNPAGDAAPARQPVLLCLFDAGQRSSRHVVRQLDEQAAALRQQGVSVLLIQAAVTSDDVFNEWKSARPGTWPVGRVTEKSEKSKWVVAVPELPWLILTDASRRVIAEGFSPGELDAQLQKLAK